MKAIFISNPFPKSFDYHPASKWFQKIFKLTTKPVVSIDACMNQRAVFFIIDSEYLFRSRNMSATCHQLRNLMEEHPSAKLLIFGFKQKWWIRHLLEDLKTVAGIVFVYSTMTQLVAEKELATSFFAPEV